MKTIRFSNVANLLQEIYTNNLEQYILVRLDDREITLDDNFHKRMTQVANDCDSSITYCNYREITDEDKIEYHPVNDYQIGSLRDDFDFGSLVMLNATDVITASEDLDENVNEMLDGGWYALRLVLAIGRTVVQLPEYLYSVRKVDYRKSGEKQHDYVSPRNREYQKDMERAFTSFLNLTGARLFSWDAVDVSAGNFPVEATVVIPVRNRVNTIVDAVRSALQQQCDFSFNVIVVDNGSTDGTREKLLEIADPKLKLILLDGTEGLGIGGCWNRALLSSECGRFAIQLDSDDLYSSPSTVAKIVAKFYEESCAMVIGSYELTDFNLNPLPPGLIDHREWTPQNGANNALRINGLGAPRAFYTPIAREFLFPNVSYGEDYAMALRICRQYKIGRIYENLYYCRRWEGNSDASLSVEKSNANNEYKDFIRSLEFIARMRMAADDSEGEDNDMLFDEEEEVDE